MTTIAGCSFTPGIVATDAPADSVPDAVAITWTVDGSSNKGVPRSGTEWQQVASAYTLSSGVPDHVWLLQETSGTAADSIGSASLGPVNAPTYQNAVAGWSRVAVGTIDRDGDTGFATASFGNLDSTPYLVLAYVAVIGTPTKERSLIGIGAASDHRFVGITATRRLEAGGGTASPAVGTVDPITTVHPIVLALDPMKPAYTVYTDQEKLAATPIATASLGGLLILGSASLGTPATRYLYAAGWAGDRAKLDDAGVKRLLVALGWTVTGY